jgi:Polysaccharide deacetylase
VTVVLTGDVHQWIESADRAYAKERESELAVEYARIAARHGLKVTLFFTGRAVIEDPSSVRALLDEGNVELGGHGWDSFRPAWRYQILRRLFGSPHGPRVAQSRMVLRTCATIERVTGRRVHSWRDHAYHFDSYTPQVLADAGVRVWSDEVDPLRPGPYRHISGIVSLPINTTPDHEHVYHGGQSVATVSVDRRSQYSSPDAWRAQVLRQTASLVERGGTATILAHPLCMKVFDDWRTFELLCSSLASFHSSWAREAEPPRAATPESFL